MWKWLVIILWFALLRSISSQPVANENVRESRQLNFGECCPCPDSERSFKDQDVLGLRFEPTLLDDSCPCRSTQDSESASSIFRPAMRAVEPFTRLKESVGDPKPLLNPEVGLASSVLETLREVTDQEYQEALERDAARSAIKEMERNIENETPTNIVNIILQPKEDQIDDPIPEASHVQETRCVHAPLGRENTFYEKRVKAPVKLFREPFFLPKDTNNGLGRKKYFDMANSASNVQELVIPPLKNSILEDLKLKSDLLKMKLFPSIRNGLKDTKTIDIMNPFEKEPGGNNPNNVQALRVPNFKLASIVDLLRASKQKNLYSVSPPNLKETDNYQENDFITSPSENNFLINNGKNKEKPETKKFYKKTEDPLTRNTNVKAFSTNKNDSETEKEGTLYNSNLRLAPFTKAYLNTKPSSSGDSIRKNECIVNEEPELKNEELTNNDNIQSVDVGSSPSEIVQIEKPVDNIRGIADDLIKECDTDHVLDITTNADKSIIQNEILDLQTKKLEGECEENSESTTTVKFKSTETNNECDMEDSESNAIGSSIRLTDTQLNEEDNFSFDNSNKVRTYSPEPDVDNDQYLNYKSSVIPTTENVLTTIYPGNMNKTNTLPHIKSDVLKTLENFKKANERIQEKLRSNVQNALQLDFMTKNLAKEIESTTLSTTTNDVTEGISKIDKNLSMQDLQEMSDHILASSEKCKTKNTDSPKDLKDSKASESKNVLTENPLSEIIQPNVSGYSIINSKEIVDKINISNEEEKDETNSDILDSKLKEPCFDVVPKVEPTGTDITSPTDPENEMMSEASSPIVNSIRQFHPDFNSEPKSDVNLKEFLINLRSSVSDILNNKNNEDINCDTNTNSYRAFGNHNTDSVFLKKEPINFHFKETKSRLNDARNIDSLKLRNNDLNSFQAKVPSPDSLNIKSIPTVLNKRISVNELLSNSPEKTSASNVLQNPLELPSISNFRAISNNARKNIEPRPDVQTSNLLQDIVSKTGPMTSLSENLKSRTEEVLRNIQENFDSTLRKSYLANPNNIFSETVTKPDVLGTISKTSYDISKKLQDFNSDLKDKLFMISQKSPDILPARDISTLLTKNKINDFNEGPKTIPTYNPQAKTNALLKTKQNQLSKPILSQPVISSIKKASLSKPHLNQNLRHSPRRLSSDLIDKKHIPKLKTTLTKNTKRKPLTESKISFSLTTTSAPEIMKSISNQKTLTKLLPSSLRSSINLPKPSTPLKTPLQKRLELKSKLKSGDSNPSASETSHTAFPKRNFDILKSSNTFSPKEESMLTPNGLLNEETSSPGHGGLSVENIREVPIKENSALSKLKSAANVNKNKKLFDIQNNILKSSLPGDAQSASNNMNISTSSFKGKPLKENVSYKCKMICFEDFEDSK